MALPVWGGVQFGPLGTRIRRILDKLSSGCSGLYITSAYRPGDPGYHGGYNNGAAVDVGFGYGSSGDKARARCLAAKLYAYSGDLSELIVTDVGSSNSMGGYYVKNGRRVSAYAAADHRNHIHVAMTPTQVARWEARLSSAPAPKPPAPAPPPSGGGSSGGSNPYAEMPYYSRPTVRRGNSGGAVGHLQFLLRDRLGYRIDRVSGSPFGPQTESAVKDFQRKYNHLAADGIVGDSTWAQLEVAAAQAITNKPEIRRGSSGMWVGYAQHCLRKAGYNIEDLQGFPFGPQTEAAVKSFQNKYLPGISRKGVIGRQTWAALDAIERGDKPGGGSSPPPPSGEPTVRRGDQGSAVCKAQERLRVHGYRIDKFSNCPFGPQTESAVRNFQSRKGLPVDGVVGPSTWKKLNEKPSSAPPPSSGGPPPVSGSGHRVPQTLEWVGQEVERRLPGARYAGVGPSSTRAYGYHNSRARHDAGITEQGRRDYSVQVAADRVGDAYLYSAVDISGEAATRTMTSRLIAATNRRDPRLKYIREFFGSLDNRRVTGRNHDSENDTWNAVTSDNSHLWHVHISFFRKYAGSQEAAKAVVDVLLGR